jgi:mannose-1-phosphate guanylyltransferase
MGWSDVGDWHGLGELFTADGQGNCGQGDLVDVLARDCVVWSETDRVVAVVGLSNLVVVDTADALLVADRAQAQMVRRVVERLERRGGESTARTLAAGPVVSRAIPPDPAPPRA